MRRLGYGLLLLGIISTGYQLVVVVPQLPAHVASHFGVNGRPDAWMSRSGFVLFFVGTQIGVAGLILTLGKLSYKLPVGLINLPNKEYWLHEDRRLKTLSFNESNLIWIAGLTTLFMSAVLWMALEANLQGRGLHEPMFLASLTTYMALVVESVIRLMRRFQIPTS
jgi:uncharacterized membrane protein